MLRKLLVVSGVMMLAFTVGQARADLVCLILPSEEGLDISDPKNDNDTATIVSSLLNKDVLRLDRWEDDGGLLSDLLEGELIVTQPGAIGDDRSAGVAWDLTGNAYEAWAVAVKERAFAGSDVDKWLYYAMTPAQRTIGGGFVDTLENGAGDISHIALYGKPTTTVPGSGTLLLLGTALSGLWFMRRKSA